MADTVATRLFVLSDTHGDAIQLPTDQHYDVAIHCGDLTEESKLAEFKASLGILSSINAPLKLVIGGNHDFTLDTPMFKKQLDEHSPPLEDELVKREFGAFGEARALFDEDHVRKNGVIFLDEGTHRFELQNGAVLTVYASPYTPSKNDWGFQYDPADGHQFVIGNDVDVVITHGPPKGILDYTDGKQRAGCPDLFEAVYRSKPKMHCFGHIHESWGAKKVHWREEGVDEPTHFTAIDNDRSTVIERLAGLEPRKFDTPERRDEKAAKKKKYQEQGYCWASAETVEPGTETLFLNAAIQGAEQDSAQLPWVVEIHLPKTRPSHVALAMTKRKRDIEEEILVKKLRKSEAGTG